MLILLNCPYKSTLIEQQKIKGMKECTNQLLMKGWLRIICITSTNMCFMPNPIIVAIRTWHFEPNKKNAKTRIIHNILISLNIYVAPTLQIKCVYGVWHLTCVDVRHWQMWLHSISFIFQIIICVDVLVLCVVYVGVCLCVSAS
jgi:hypothetical protein